VSHPSKKKGWVGEDNARAELRILGMTGIERTGSLNYQDAAPDLVQEGFRDAQERPVLIVATQADRRPMLYSLTAADLRVLLVAQQHGVLDQIPVAVQVKKHKRFALDTLHRALQEAVKRVSQ
jgi:hypothetical protein